MDSCSFRGMLRPLTCAVALLASGVPAQAQPADSTASLEPPKDDAEVDAKIRSLMRAGVAEYRKKNLEGARQAFAQAWATAHRPVVAAALADVEMKLGRYRDAAEHWDYYLQSKPADQADAAARLEECRVHVAAVRVELEPEGAELDVDGNRTPMPRSGGTLWLDPGMHTLTARFEGRASSTQRLDATAGQDVSVRLVVAKVAAPVPAATPTSPLRAEPRAPVAATTMLPASPKDASGDGIEPRTIVAIGGTALTLAGSGLGVWFVVQRSNADAEREQILNGLYAQFPGSALAHNVCVAGPDRPAACDNVAAKANEADRAGNWAVGSFVGAGVFGAATVVTYLLWPTAKESAAKSAIIVTPLGEPHAHGLRLSAVF